jgi:ferredoxin
MAHVIDLELCISCGACIDACPEEAISDETGDTVIDAALCTDCATCADQCPSEAIKPAD